MRERRVDVQHRREFFIFHRNLFQRFLRTQFIFGDDGRHWFANETHLPNGEQRMVFDAVSVEWVQAGRCTLR